MTQVKLGPWRLKHTCSGIGSGFNNYAGFITDEQGKEVASFVDRATLITRYGNGITREEQRRWGVTFEEDEPYPHSAEAFLLAAAPDLLEALEAALRKDAGWVVQARAAVAKARGEEVSAWLRSEPST